MLRQVVRRPFTLVRVSMETRDGVSRVVAMHVRMKMHPVAPKATRQVGPEKHQHHADGPLQGVDPPVGQHDAEHHHGAPEQQQRERVAQAPENTLANGRSAGRRAACPGGGLGLRLAAMVTAIALASERRLRMGSNPPFKTANGCRLTV